MQTETKTSSFAKYAWFVLAYNLVVILWGVFLRASKSGDGCGQHWLTCQGEMIPSAPELKTVIEFSHRLTSALDGVFVIILLIWAFRIWRSGKSTQSASILKMAVSSFILVLIEGAIGGGLVLTGNTAETLTPARPFWMAAHLINTLILLAALTLTAWSASGGKKMAFRVNQKYLLGLILGVVLIMLIGISGSIAALSSMIFPSATIADGITQDFSPTSHILLRLRLLHPILAIFSSVYLIFLAGWLKAKNPGSPSVGRWSNVLSVLVLVQIAFGALTLLTLAPIIMQLGHLFLADAVWITLVLISANILSQEDLGLV